jgi:hypothetical protein
MSDAHPNPVLYLEAIGTDDKVTWFLDNGLVDVLAAERVGVLCAPDGVENELPAALLSRERQEAFRYSKSHGDEAACVARELGVAEAWVGGGDDDGGVCA